MIMTVDVGNTDAQSECFQGRRGGDKLWRITTKMSRTSDEYGILLINLLEQNKIGRDEIVDVIIASVVPNVMHSLEGAVVKYF